MKSPRPVTTAVPAPGRRARTRRMPSATSSSCASASALAMRVDGRLVEHLAVAADDARQPLAGELARRRDGRRRSVPCSPPARAARATRARRRSWRNPRPIPPRVRPRAGPRGAAPPPASGPRRCRRARRLRSRAGSVRPRAATRPPSSGMMSVEVVPMSTRMPSGTNRPTSVAVAAQFDAPTASGSAAAAAGVTNRPSTVYTCSGSAGKARASAPSTNATPSRFVRNACESSAVMVTACGHPSACPSSAASDRSTEGERLGIALDLEGHRRASHRRRPDPAAPSGEVDPGRLRVHAADVPAEDRRAGVSGHRASVAGNLEPWTSYRCSISRAASPSGRRRAIGRATSPSSPP